MPIIIINLNIYKILIASCRPTAHIYTQHDSLLYWLCLFVFMCLCFSFIQFTHDALLLATACAACVQYTNNSNSSHRSSSRCCHLAAEGRNDHMISARILSWYTAFNALHVANDRFCIIFNLFAWCSFVDKSMASCSHRCWKVPNLFLRHWKVFRKLPF